MKKMFVAAVAALLVLALAACSGPAASSAAPSVPVSEPAASVSSVPVESTPVAVTSLRIAGLKGPTTMGMVRLMANAEAGQAAQGYQVEMFGTPDEVNALLIGGEIDIAAVPANVASILYNKTGGKVQVAAINTLGVLYVVETGDSIQSVEDLKGRTIYSTGKGTTPEYVLNYILEQNGIDPETDVDIQFKSESTEVAAMLKDATDAVAVLPQPYVTAVQLQNDQVRMALDLTEEWSKASPESGLVTGVLVARTEFVEQNQAAFDAFLLDYQASIEWVNANTTEAAELVAQYGIVEKAPVAEKALPYCNITYIAGQEMKDKLAGYLQVLFDQQPEAVGGQLPDDGFYYGLG